MCFVRWLWDGTDTRRARTCRVFVSIIRKRSRFRCECVRVILVNSDRKEDGSSYCCDGRVGLHPRINEDKLWAGSPCSYKIVESNRSNGDGRKRNREIESSSTVAAAVIGALERNMLYGRTLGRCMGIGPACWVIFPHD